MLSVSQNILLPDVVERVAGVHHGSELRVHVHLQQVHVHRRWWTHEDILLRKGRYRWILTLFPKINFRGDAMGGHVKIPFCPNCCFAWFNCLNINMCFRDWWSGGIQASSEKQVIDKWDNILYLLKCSNELILSLRMTWYFLHNRDIWRDNLWNCDILREFIDF